MSDATSPTNEAAMAARIAVLEAALTAERELRASVEAERDRLREAYEALLRDVELARRRLLIAKAERIDTTQLELEFAAKLAALDALAGQVAGDGEQPEGDGGTKPSGRGKRNKPTGRRNLNELDLPVERIVITDPVLDGKAQRIGVETSHELRWRRGGFVRLEITRIKYSTTRLVKDVDGAAAATTVSDEVATTAEAATGETAVVVQAAAETVTVDVTASSSPTVEPTIAIEVEPVLEVDLGGATPPASTSHEVATASEAVGSAAGIVVPAMTEMINAVAVTESSTVAPASAAAAVQDEPILGVDAAGAPEAVIADGATTELATTIGRELVPQIDVAAPAGTAMIAITPIATTIATSIIAAPLSTCVIGQRLPGVVIAAMPPRLLQRSIATPSLLAHIASDKFCDGLPLHRQEDRFARLGVPLDRGTMCRWLEEAGGIVGATIVEAMRREATRIAFCIATDATGISVQPDRHPDKKRQPCRRAHFFVLIADADHVFFEYTPEENSKVVSQMFRDFAGFVQADAKSVFDILFRPPNERDLVKLGDLDRATRHELGCWSHARRKFWEAAVATQDVVAREALARIMRMFVLERSWNGCSTDERKALRERHLRPHVVEFFKFIEPEYERSKDQRGLLRTALGYAVRQRDALMRFFEDGRLEMTNNHSERQLRRIATGRNAWLFVGSDIHGQSTANLFTLIASARLHKLDPEVYLRDVFRVLPFWPRDRYIELAPRYWRITRARLDPRELELEIGWLTIPEPPLPTP